MNPAVHISLNVSDLDRSVAFYRKFLGEPRKLHPGYAKFVSAEPEIHLALNESPRHVRGGSLSHLGIRVGSTQEVLRRRDELAGRGLAPHDEIKTDCCYGLQDKFWITDPDGNRWEVYTVLKDTEGRSAKEEEACCTR